MAINREKCCPETGDKVKNYLKEMDVESPILQPMKDYSLEVKKGYLEDAFTSVMAILNMDLTDSSLKGTPRRIAKMYLDEVFYGLDYQNFPRVMVSETIAYDGIVHMKNIKVHSFCEHHFVPIVGVAHVAYLPNENVIGLSKINRIVDFFCRRPQVQERLTSQIYYALECLLETENVAVTVTAEHMCVKLRGVEDQQSETTTTLLGGVFKEGALRNEYYTLIK